MRRNWRAFDLSNSLGDPGTQPAVKAKHSRLAVGIADTELDFLSLETTELRACSTRGWRHRSEGSQRQDSFCLLSTDDFLIAAVADGVSEGEQSYVAAETAARAACKLASDQLSRSGGLDLVQLSRRISLRIIEEAEYRQLIAAPEPNATIDERLRATLSAMATTLLLAVVDHRPSHQGLRAQVCVVAGDSSAYTLHEGRFQRIGGGKQLSDPVSTGAVRPLPGTVDSVLAEVFLQPGDLLLIATDGVGDILLNGDGEAGRMLAGRWAEPPTIDRFFCDVNAYRRTFDDDRTAVGIWASTDLHLPIAPAEGLKEPESQAGPSPEPLEKPTDIPDATQRRDDVKEPADAWMQQSAEPMEVQQASGADLTALMDALSICPPEPAEPSRTDPTDQPTSEYETPGKASSWTL